MPAVRSVCSRLWHPCQPSLRSVTHVLPYYLSRVRSMSPRACCVAHPASHPYAAHGPGQHTQQAAAACRRRLGVLAHHLPLPLHTHGGRASSDPAACSSSTYTLSAITAAGAAAGHAAAAAPGEQPHRQPQQQQLAQAGGDDATAGDTHTKQRSDLDGDEPPTALEKYQFDLNGVRAARLRCCFGWSNPLCASKPVHLISCLSALLLRCATFRDSTSLSRAR